MEGAARNTRRQIARVGQVALLLSACATIQDPPGGPPDFDPPFIVSVTPDSGAVVADFDDDVQVRFNEVIDERSGSGLENLVLLSPRPEELNVSWKRSRITIKPKDGWQANIVYQLTLLPGFADLRNNRLDSTKTVVFSTGGEIPDTRITGTVLDWEQGGAAPGALVEAIRQPDSLVFMSSADSVGDFEIRYLHPGTYLLSATVDQNDNRMRDYREVFDSVTVQLDSSLSHVMWAFAHDTVGPRISEVTDLDSVTIQVEFTQKLVPGEPDDTVVKVFALPDTTLVETVAIWNQPTYDSVRTEEAVADSIRQAAVADSMAALEAEADTAGAAGADTARAPAADTLGAAADSIVEGLLQVVDSAGQIMEDSAAVTITEAGDTLMVAAAADTSRVLELLSERPELSSTWFVRLAASMVPGARYFVTAVAENVSGAIAESENLLILPEPVDTTEVPADTT